MALELRVLGSAAGGGFPQWNCACHNCARARSGELEPRLQDSLAVSANRHDWFLLNASPDLARQIERTPELWPRSGRGSPIRGVVLTNGDLDHVLGLLLLRESQPLAVYATNAVRAGLERNVMLKTLERFEGQLVWQPLELDREVELRAANGEASGVLVRPFAAPGKLPLHLSGLSDASPEDNLGLSLREARGTRRAVYASATSDASALEAAVAGADTLLLDGTFWTNDELITLGLGSSTARQMAHQPLSGAEGSIAQASRFRVGKKLFTHINNTNPILEPGSSERRQLREQGWELAEDGMSIRL